MALVIKDRVKETTTSTGTGALTLAGAASGFRSFSVVGNGNTTYYAIVDPATGDWETGIGTYSTTGPTLTRTTVLESSNSNALVNFAAGSKEVFVTYPAERAKTAQVGEVVLATSAPDGPGTWLETGKYYSKAAYPELAAVVGDVPDLGSVAQIPQAQLPVAFVPNSSGYLYITATDGVNTVLVGQAGAIRKTSDGTNWIPIPSGTTSILNAVIYANGNFIAVGGSAAITTSNDSTNWVVRTPPTTSNLNSVAFGNNKYVAVGVSGTTIYSSDLVNWARAAGTGTNTFTNVIYANSLFVAVGFSGALYTSSDGITWTSRSAGSSTFVDVIYANSLFVAVGASGACYTSPDGITWTSRSAGSNQFNQVIYANSLFVAVGNTNTIYTSSDGVTWTSRTSGFVSSTATISAVTWNGTNYIAICGGSGTPGRWAISSDGITWIANVDVSASLFRSVAVVNGKTIAFGANSCVILAGATRAEVLQGGTWAYTVSAQSATNPRTIAYNGSNQYVAAGSNGIMLTSSDGQAWTAYNTGVTTNFDKVQYLNGNYIAMGGAGSATNLLTSPDGTTWTARTAGTAVYNAAAFGASTYVVVGAGGAVFSSTDLVTWTSRSAGANTFNDVIFANSVFVAVGASNSIYSSADGATWTLRTATGTFNRIIYDNSLFVAVGNGVIFTSSDGTTWTQRTSNVGSTILNDVVWNGTIFCAVGANGVITTSPDGVTWTALFSGDNNTSLLNVSWSGTRFVATNFTLNGVAWVSTDGITWNRASTAYRGTTLYSAYLGGRFLAVGPNHIQTSTDGLNWRNCDHVQYVPNSVNRLYKLGSYYYAATNAGLFESTDGVTFTIADRTIPPAPVVSLAYSGSAWLAVMAAASGQPQSFYKSTDGLTWSKSADFGTLTSTTALAGAVFDITYGGGNFVSAQTLTGAQNISAGIYTSPDGVTWSPSVFLNGLGVFSSATASSLASSGSNVYAVSAAGIIIKSTDGGITWSRLTTGTQPIYANGYLITTNNATSDDSNFVTMSFATGSPPNIGVGIYVYQNFAYTIPNTFQRILINLKTGALITYQGQMPPADFFAGFSSNQVKEYPVRGSVVLRPNTAFNNNQAVQLIGEFNLYSYNTSTTFWVPPAGTAIGQTAYIYAGA